jgi:lysophospholipase L1-like esterase
MIGDSITDFDRARPVGEGLFEAIGKSYVSIVDAMLKVTYPQSRIRVVNMGISGNTVRDLKQRWTSDVLGLHPDWVSVLIGVIDVWRQFDSPLMPETHVPIGEYEATYEQLIQTTLREVEGMILISPYYMEPNREDPMRRMMEDYARVAKALAEKYRLVFVDLQAAFDSYFQYYSPQTIAWDRIHPNVTGHVLIARAILSAIGYTWQGA